MNMGETLRSKENDSTNSEVFISGQIGRKCLNILAQMFLWGRLNVGKTDENNQELTNLTLQVNIRVIIEIDPC